MHEISVPACPPCCCMPSRREPRASLHGAAADLARSSIAVSRPDLAGRRVDVVDGCSRTGPCEAAREREERLHCFTCFTCRHCAALPGRCAAGCGLLPAAARQPSTTAARWRAEITESRAVARCVVCGWCHARQAVGGGYASDRLYLGAWGAAGQERHQALPRCARAVCAAVAWLCLRALSGLARAASVAEQRQCTQTVICSSVDSTLRALMENQRAIGCLPL
jgi:hypothetical protein